MGSTFDFDTGAVQWDNAENRQWTDIYQVS